jgi:TolB-like protein
MKLAHAARLLLGAECCGAGKHSALANCTGVLVLAAASGPFEADASPIARATLFGEFRLTDCNGAEITLANRRARALLAILCLEPNQSLPRDQITRLLWSGRFEAQAKASLRQCLLELSKSLEPLGQPLLVVTRERVAIQSANLQTDLADLEAALTQGRHEEAIRSLDSIGAHRLLNDLNLGDTFSDWLATRREQIVLHLRALVDRAMEELDDPVLRKRLLNAWAVLQPFAASATVPVSSDSKTRIAVLPFQSLGGADGPDYFTDGMVDELITTLGQVPQLLVAGRTSSFHYRDSELTPAQISRELGVTHLIEGSVQRQGEQIRIHVHLIAGDTGFELWGQRFDGTLGDVFELQERIAQAITIAIGGALGISMRAPVVAGMTHSKEAYDLYLQGRSLNARLFGDGVLTRAAELVEKAVALDPQFAEAWVLLGDIHQRMGIYIVETDMTEASATMADCVRKALAIKSNLGHAYGLLALHEFTQNNIVGSLDLAFKGYEVEPNNPAVSVRLGGLLLFCGLTRRGMELLDKAIDQDPADGRHYMVRSAGQLNLGKIDASIADAQRCVDLGFPSIWLGVAHAAAGNHDIAVDCYQRSRLMLNNSIPPPSGVTPMSPEMMDAYWLVAAKGVCSGVPEDREAYCRTLDFLHATMIEKEHLAITAPAVFMGYADLLFKTIGTRITLQNLACLMSIWVDIDPIRQIWQHPEFIPFAQRIGMADAWDKYGWPDLLPPPRN